MMVTATDNNRLDLLGNHHNGEMMRSGNSDDHFHASVKTENYGAETLKSRTSKQIQWRISCRSPFALPADSGFGSRAAL